MTDDDTFAARLVAEAERTMPSRRAVWLGLLAASCAVWCGVCALLWWLL